MKYFIIGGTGSIGSVLIPAASEAGHEVVGLARSDTAAQSLRSLGAVPVRGDMTAPKQWLAEAAEADVLVQLGATPPPTRSSNKWLQTGGEANGIAAMGLVEAAKEGGKTKALITASGVMVAGDHGDAWIDESTSDKPHPLATYWGPNEHAVEAARDAGVPATVLRFGQVYDSQPTSTFGRFFLATAAKGQFRYMGDGDNYFPFVHVRDAVDAIIRTATTPADGLLYIVEDDIDTMKTSVTAMMTAFGYTAKSVPLFIAKLAAGKPAAAGFSGSYRARNNRAKEVLGWSPSRPSFTNAIASIVDQYQTIATRGQPAATGSMTLSPERSTK